MYIYVFDSTVIQNLATVCTHTVRIGNTVQLWNDIAK